MPPPWVAVARAQAQRPAAGARMPLLLGGTRIGSVEARIFDEIGLQRLSGKRWQLSKVQHEGDPAWRVDSADGTAALNELAGALRRAGRCGPWRDEQLDVWGADGARVATVERGAARVLGLATQAVHLVSAAPGGAHLWVQQRSLDKPTHPGAWDTLMGGMVSAGDSLDAALARETWEEAGLRLAQFTRLAPGGHVDIARPCDEGGPGCGWMAERITWFHATLPAPLEPAGHDGEVLRFACLAHADVQALLAQGAFTPEAALVLAAYYGW